MFKFAGIVAVGAALALVLGMSLANADSASTNFEPTAYSPGSIDNQQSWGSGCPDEGINPAVDQAIVTNSGAPASFGTQSWRFSNAYADGAFGLWPFSPSLANEAGETSAQNGGCSAGTRQTHFEAQWSFTSAAPGSEQVNLQVSTAPDRGDGARMSYIRMEDNPGGLEVFFDDYQSGLNETGCLLGLNFVETSVASNLNRATAHTVKLVIDFVDGTANDVVKVYVDGTLRHTGTTWEDYFRECELTATRTVDSMLFQARNNAAPLLDGQGFLFDNLSYSTASTPVDKDDCKKGGWQTVTRADGSAFKNQGDCIQYANTGK